ncbi:MAG: imelysin family protein [Pseudomonadota bacterium]
MSNALKPIARLLRASSIGVLLVALAACGGGGGGSSSAPPPTQSPPAPAPTPDPTPDPDPDPDPEPVPVEAAVALEQLVDDVIIAGAESFQTDAQGLLAGAESFCASGSTDLAELQSGWEGLMERWFFLANYVFGPLNDNIVSPVFYFIDSLRLRGTDYTETVRAVIAEDISSDQVLNDEFFAGKTFQRVGLLALEVALFETATGERSQDLAMITAEYGNTPRKCEVLIGLARQLTQQADYVVDGWLVQHRNATEPYRTLFLAGETDDGTEPMAQLIIAIQEHLEYLQSRRVVEVAAQLSQHNWDAVSAGVDGAEAYLEGAGEDSVSFFDVMIENGETAVVDEVRGTLAAIREAIDLQDPAILEVRLGQLDGNFKREIADALGVELGINFSDGDGS